MYTMAEAAFDKWWDVLYRLIPNSTMRFPMTKRVETVTKNEGHVLVTGLVTRTKVCVFCRTEVNEKTTKPSTLRVPGIMDIFAVDEVRFSGFVFSIFLW